MKIRKIELSSLGAQNSYFGMILACSSEYDAKISIEGNKEPGLELCCFEGENVDFNIPTKYQPTTKAVKTLPKCAQCVYIENQKHCKLVLQPCICVKKVEDKGFFEPLTNFSFPGSIVYLSCLA